MKFQKLEIPKTKKFEELRSKYSKASKEDLLVTIYELQKEVLSHRKATQSLKDEMEIHQSKIEETKNKIDRSNEKRSNGRKRLFAKNEEFLRRSISVFHDFLDRPFLPTDYIKFQRYVTKVFPTPDYIPTPRLTRAEKRRSADEQKEILELKKRTGWSQSNLREFFWKETNVKPSTNKNSSINS